MVSGPRFNPLDTRAIGNHVVEALLTRPAEPLGELKSFTGAGIYVIYYTGPFPAYAMIAKENANGAFKRPIYIGKAVPPGARTGGVLADEYIGTALFRRLMDHAESIRSADNLNIADFYVRYLVVDDVWIPLAEALLITKLAPIWNSLLIGFGNHDPGKGRHAGLRPRWDTLHSGRAWATKCQPRAETAEQLAQEIEASLRLGADLTQFLEVDNGEPDGSTK